MTILGMHTVMETVDLIRATEFRVKQVMEQWRKVKLKRLNPPTAAQVQLDKDVDAFINRWTSARDAASLEMLAITTATPLVPMEVLPAEIQFANVDNATRRDSPRLGDIQNRLDIEAKALGLKAIDLSATPSQNSADLDFQAFKGLDAAIKSGEKAVKDAAKSNAGLLIGAGLLGVLGIVVVTKVYL
jgi:hypothetical protein